MIQADMLVALLGLLLAVLYQWLFRVLPREHWQFVAILPVTRDQQGQWQGLNLTWYGAFTAAAAVSAVTVFLLLTASAGAPLMVSLVLTLMVLAVCFPAARLIARVVEKSRHGFTVGGASFVGMLLAPLLLWVAHHLMHFAGQPSLPVLPMLAALSIAYVLGEGMGRLACISFGCCYGKPVNASPELLAPLFERVNHVFHGETRKIAFAGGLQQRAVIPVQAVTCCLYTLLALAGMALFFRGQHEVAFILTLVGSQLWRLYSEQLRADYLGGAKILSVYQVMALAGCIWAVAISYLLPQNTAGLPQLNLGFEALWNPVVLVLLQVLALTIFLFSGRSTITISHLRFGLAPDWQQQAGCEDGACNQRTGRTAVNPVALER